MGIINAENLISFRPSEDLFNRIKKYLSSFDSQSMLDTGDFYDYVIDVLEDLGVAVYKECEWIGHVHDYKIKLPCNFKLWYAGYKVHPDLGFVPSINEQKPWIWYQDSEISQICPPTVGKCKIDCKEDLGQVKIVVRTFVNGDEWNEYNYRNPLPLILSPNVKDHHSEYAKHLLSTSWNEVTIDHEHILHTRFKQDAIYLQYYGLPLDDNLLPMIPDVPQIEKAIEFYIYMKCFEGWYLNSAVPNIADKLKYISEEFNKMYMPKALFYVKSPSFQRTLQSIRLLRSRNKFYEFDFDRTRMISGRPHGSYTGFPLV